MLRPMRTTLRYCVFFESGDPMEQGAGRTPAADKKVQFG
jgi:hypothetical protein